MNERALDISNDIFLEGGSVARCVTLKDSVAMRVRTLLQTFVGEVFHAPNYGTPWFQKILGRDELSLSYARQVVSEKISQVEGVRSVDSVSVQFKDRNLSVSYTARLDDGGTVAEEVNIG